MDIFKALKSIFNTKNEKALKISDIKLGEEYQAYIDYLKNILRFEPIIKVKKHQIVFFNVFFEKIKFENFTFQFEEKTDGKKHVTAVYLVSTYEHKEQAQSSFESVREAFCKRFKVIGTCDVPHCYSPVYILENKYSDDVLRLGMAELAKDDYAYDNYAVVLAITPHDEK